MRTEDLKEALHRHRKAELGFFPTPLHRLNNISDKLGVNLYLKRDDMTGMNLFGGNKIRKLEYLIGDALNSGCDYVFTYGATQSNHAMQTVTACRRYGLKPVIYLTAVVNPDKDDVRSNLLLDVIMDAEIHIVEIRPGESEADADERAEILAKEQMEQLNKKGHKCYNIPMGGASPVGSLGFIEGVMEFEEQQKNMGIKADYIFHATGTGGTMAGLVAGKKILGTSAEIISIAVSEKRPEYEEKTASLANKSLQSLESDTIIDPKTDIKVDRNYYLPGYEIPSKEASEAIKYLAVNEGILVDPVYTGKAFAGMLDHIKSGKVEKGSTVVFWHTGGATALFAEKEILGEIGTHTF